MAPATGKLKLMTVMGTRPEIIRLSETIKACDRYFDHHLVHTGQNYDYELNQIFFADLGLRAPDEHLDVAGGSLGQTLGNVIERSYSCLVREQPDALLVLGDTNSSLCAIAAKRLHIPVFHMEAGNRCFDERLPEETNRKIVDHIADVNLCYSEHARRNLLAEGLPANRTFVVGSPMPEVLMANSGPIERSDVLERLGLQASRFFLLSAHREENIDDPGKLQALVEAVNALARSHGLPILYSMHPRSAKALEASGLSFDPLVMKHKPLCFSDYNKLQTSAACVLSDSGTLPEESAFFAQQGKPFAAVSLRSSTERPEALETGNFVLSPIGSGRLVEAVEGAMAALEAADLPSPVPDYQSTNVSTKVAKIIASYTDVVNEMTWRK